MMTATSLSDTLPGSIPKLDASGSNWAIFHVRFKDAVDAKGFWGHFDGSKPRPIPETVDVFATAEDGTTMTIPGTPSEEQLAKVAQWEKDERSSKSLLMQKIPDSTLMKIHMKESVKERWEIIVGIADRAVPGRRGDHQAGGFRGAEDRPAE